MRDQVEIVKSEQFNKIARKLKLVNSEFYSDLSFSHWWNGQDGDSYAYVFEYVNNYTIEPPNFLNGLFVCILYTAKTGVKTSIRFGDLSNRKATISEVQTGIDSLIEVCENCLTTIKTKSELVTGAIDAGSGSRRKTWHIKTSINDLNELNCCQLEIIQNTAYKTAQSKAKTEYTIEVNEHMVNRLARFLTMATLDLASL